MRALFTWHGIYLAVFWSVYVAVIIAPPLLIENAEWTHRKIWLFAGLPLALIAMVWCLLPGNISLSLPRQNRFQSPVARIVAAIAIVVPLFLVIPTLNGWTDDTVLRDFGSGVSKIGAIVMPAIRNIATENAERFPEALILKAQTVSTYTYFSILLAFALVVHPKKARSLKLIDETEDGKREGIYEKIYRIGGFIVVGIPIALYMLWRSIFGWGISKCNGAFDFALYTNCALGDDLLLFVNAHFVPIIAVIVAMCLLGMINTLIRSIKE